MATRFKKAQPAQARIKMSLYGPPGSGKTFTALLMAEGLAKFRNKRIAFVDTERGTDFYAQHVARRRVHPHAFDFDAIYTRSIADTAEACYALDEAEHGVVVLDSISHLWDAAIDAYGGRKTKIDSIPMHAWGKIKKPYKDLISWLIGSNMDVFILGRQKNVFEENEKDEMTKVGVTMRAEGETAYEPHVCLRMESKINPRDTTQHVHYAYCEKDRTGVLDGLALKNPGFADIEPLLPLLGETQAPAENSDDRAMKDSDHMDAVSEAKDRAKEERSAALYQEFSVILANTPDAVHLAEVQASIRKALRGLTETHSRALKELFNITRQKLVPEA